MAPRTAAPLTSKLAPVEDAPLDEELKLLLVKALTREMAGTHVEDAPAALAEPEAEEAADDDPAGDVAVADEEGAVLEAATDDTAVMVTPTARQT